ncbi:pep2-like protein [Verruconis gallopava]|uniref:Pep2-like protein n=1 Tax=Verruconis gallopava TaxID=253628 RepID=A0A0D2ABK0_9PEZI|nr:pep2-like protein [Verruconis gallopava]KIW04198.1 pep2-like protein [Verruconis gallopava]
MVDLHSLPQDFWPRNSLRNNGPVQLLMERMYLRELAEGWPCYRDACEWDNFASIFHDDAHVYTTWSGRVHFHDFIEASKAGIDKGAFIMHRCHGLTTDINPEGTRAVTKMKATITQRFVLDGAELDVECDCRFCFFFEKADGRWGARFVRHWYEKDKLIPCNPAKIPNVDEEKLKTYPDGYKFLAYFQEAIMGAKVLPDMPGHRRHAGTPNGDKHDLLYLQAKEWLEGKNLIF